MKIPLSTFGPKQTIDLFRSRATKWFTHCTRVTKVSESRIVGDRTPFHMSRLFGGNIEDYDLHVVFQVSGCPLRCYYCYVDNLKPDVWVDAYQLKSVFDLVRLEYDVKVVHLCGGCPGRYADILPELRDVLPDECVILLDVILTENFLYNVKPWSYLKLPNILIRGCLKGTDPVSFQRITGRSLFYVAITELMKYLPYRNFILTIVDDRRIKIPDWMYKHNRVDILKVCTDYEAVKKRANRSFWL